VNVARIGAGLDVHAFTTDPDRPLVLCGVHLPDAPGLAGHSDADVGAHAVADALLGAGALGDLGSRFGVDRPEVAGTDSLGLLAAVVTDLDAVGYRIGNVDLTLVAARPRLAPYRDAMRANLARVLGVSVDAVSVKSTTTDGLGAVGRGEGIAGWATALVVPVGADR
jgi:2-C-methyl-D-erythritol 2,4-cyclodiphosphate synthase